VPCRVQLDVLQILWLLANPLWTHDIGESGSKTITGWLLIGCSRCQSRLVVKYQSAVGEFTATPKFLSHHTPTF